MVPSQRAIRACVGRSPAETCRLGSRPYVSPTQVGLARRNENRYQTFALGQSWCRRFDAGPLESGGGGNGLAAICSCRDLMPAPLYFFTCTVRGRGHRSETGRVVSDAVMKSPAYSARSRPSVVSDMVMCEHPIKNCLRASLTLRSPSENKTSHALIYDARYSTDEYDGEG